MPKPFSDRFSAPKYFTCGKQVHYYLTNLRACLKYYYEKS